MFIQIVELTENNERYSNIKTYVFKDGQGRYLVVIPEDSLSSVMDIVELEYLFNDNGLDIDTFTIKYYNEVVIRDHELKIFEKFKEKVE